MVSILLRDPWNVVEDYDTGLGNRLLAWEVVYELSLRLKQPVNVLTYLFDYPELPHINFPKTSTQSDTIENTAELTKELMISLFTGEITAIDEDKVWETTYDWDTVVELHTQFVEDCYTKLLTFRDNNLVSLIEEFAKGCIGVHVRRGNGVYKDESTLSAVDSTTRSLYRLEPWSDTNYKFVPDQSILNAIDEVRKSSRYSKVFLGVDLDLNTVEHLKRKYPGICFTRGDFKALNREYLSSVNFNRPIANLKTLGDTILDFFILAYSEKLYLTSSSSWSRQAQLYLDREYLYVDNVI